MKQIINWIIENQDWLKEIGQILLSAIVGIYATIIHRKSKTRLNELEIRKTVEQDLLNQLTDLKNSLQKEEKR